MAKKRKRRTRTSHPGVKLKKRSLKSGRVSWRAHFTDPDTGKEVAITLKQTTHEARVVWARQKSQELARIVMDRAAGIEPDKPGPTLEAALEEYLKDARARLRPRTLVAYQAAFQRLTDWAPGASVQRTSDLSRRHLAQLRSHLIQLPRSNRRGGTPRVKAGNQQKNGRGGYRAPVTVNGELRAIKTLLTAWRRREYLPSLSSDDIADSLRALPVAKDPPVVLREVDIEQLLASAMRHDAECYDMTREEHQGARPVGTTPKYPPISPFVAYVLLTGSRLNEALSVRWADIDLDVLDRDGRKAGEVRLGSSVTKTRHGRTITLEVSPGLRRLLLAMKLQSTGAYVFGGDEPLSENVVNNARRRMMAKFGAPAFDWKSLRSTCATYLTNAPGIFGAATVFLSARQLGHSVAVAERHYLDVHRGIPREARSLDEAMGIAAGIHRLWEHVSAGPPVAQGA